MAEAYKNWFERTKDYVNELKLEMRRVTWPNRKQVEGTTAVVIFSVFAFAGLLRGGGHDAGNRHVTRLFNVLYEVGGYGSEENVYFDEQPELDVDAEAPAEAGRCAEAPAEPSREPPWPQAEPPEGAPAAAGLRRVVAQEVVHHPHLFGIRE